MKLEVTHKSFFFQDRYEYNTLPREIRSEKKNIKILKQKLGNFIISKISGLGYLFDFSFCLFCLDDCCMFSV